MPCFVGPDFGVVLDLVGGAHVVAPLLTNELARTRSPDDLPRVLARIHAVLIAHGRRGAGGYVAGLGIAQGRSFVAWAGDVRVVRLRGVVLTRLTRDHGLFEQYVDAGIVDDTPEARAAFPHPGVVVNALGMAEAKIDARDDAVELGDLFVVAHRLDDHDLLRRVMVLHRHDPAGCAVQVRESFGRDHVVCALVTADGCRWSRACGPSDDEAASESLAGAQR